MATLSELEQRLGDRLRSLVAWFESALEVYEARTPEEVELALRAYERWMIRGWDDSDEDIDGALCFAWEEQIGTGPRWADDQETMRTDLDLQSEVPWELGEMFLISGLLFSRHALESFGHRSAKKRSILAITYADASEARESWLQMRGPQGCRDQRNKLSLLHEVVRRFDEKIAGESESGQKAAHAALGRKAVAAKLRADKSGTRAAKAGALELWKERNAGRHPKLGTVEQYATEVMRRWPVLRSPTVIRRWSSAWTKAVKAGEEPSV